MRASGLEFEEEREDIQRVLQKLVRKILSDLGIYIHKDEEIWVKLKEGRIRVERFGRIK